MAGTLKDRIREQITAAMKARDPVTVGTLRMLSAAITNQEKAVLHELDDDEVRAVAAKEVKKRTEAIEAFTEAGRTELADRERAEREILASFAPEQLSEAEIDAIIDDVIAATGASGPGDMGTVMGQVMTLAKGRVDGSAVQAKVRSRLGG